MKGVKHDEGKPRLSIIFKQFPNALAAVSEQAWFGADKYKEWDHDNLNYLRCDGGPERYFNAGLRHMMASLQGDGIDGDSGLPHAYAATWCLLGYLEKYILEQKEQ